MERGSHEPPVHCGVQPERSEAEGRRKARLLDQSAIATETGAWEQRRSDWEWRDADAIRVGGHGVSSAADEREMGATGTGYLQKR